MLKNTNNIKNTLLQEHIFYNISINLYVLAFSMKVKFLNFYKNQKFLWIIYLKKRTLRWDYIHIKQKKFYHVSDIFFMENLKAWLPGLWENSISIYLARQWKRYDISTSPENRGLITKYCRVKEWHVPIDFPLEDLWCDSDSLMEIRLIDGAASRTINKL